jgi:putative membrane protein
MTRVGFSFVGLAAAFLLALGGCDQRSAPPAPKTSGPAAPAAPSKADTPTVALGETDRAFVTQAASSGLAEVEASRIAAEKAADPQVKSFAEKLVKDHAQSNQELQRIASAKGVALPTAPDGEQRAKLQKFRELIGGAVERSFLQQFGVDAHREAIKLFERQSSEGADADLKAFAEKTLPALREHLAMAERLDGGMAGGVAKR